MNKQGKTNKQKFYLLMAGVIILGVASWHFSVSKTLEVRGRHTQLTEKMRGVQSLSSELKKWKTLNEQLDSKLGGVQVLSGFHESVLRSVGRFCDQKDLTLKEFSEPFEGEDGGYRVETIVLTIEGDYKSLLEMLHHLETRFKGGKVASVSFQKKKDYRKNREELFVKMYVQKVKMKKDESA